jgi:hypothetical protein
MRFLYAFLFAAISAARPSQQSDDTGATNDYWVFSKASNSQVTARSLEQSFSTLNVLERSSFDGMDARRVNIDNAMFEKLQSDPNVSINFYLVYCPSSLEDKLRKFNFANYYLRYLSSDEININSQLD